MKRETNEFVTYFKKKDIRNLGGHIHEFNKGYQPKSNFIKDTKGDLCADSIAISLDGGIIFVLVKS